MEDVLRDLVLLFLLAGAVLVLFHRLRLPAIVGLVIAGILAGPYGFGVLQEREQIEQLAELGILLLMFSIGLDFTPDRLRELVRAAGMGVVQILFCIVVTVLLTIGFVDRWSEAVLLGFLVAHTSSTLMLKLFLDRGELSSPQVRLGLGISITQDLSAVPMLLAIPVMTGGGNGSLVDFGVSLLKVAGVLLVARALARWVIPRMLHHVIRIRSRELFLIFLFIVSLGTAWGTMAVGLSGALGAFLAGMAIASSAYSHQTLAEVVSFRDLLVSLFFISIGMLVDIGGMLQYVPLAMLLVLVILVVKYLSGFLPVLLSGYPLRIATLVGVGIAQVGEFSFVVAHAGRDAGLISAEAFQLFVLVAILTMLVNPLLVATGPAILRAMTAVPWLCQFEGRSRHEESTQVQENHVVVAGYGLNGRTVAQALRTLGVPHVVLDINPDAVRAAQTRDEAVFYGDCTRVEVLRKAHLETAHAFVVAISDPQATRQAVQVARNENPALDIIVRTRYLTEIEVLRNLGADVVIAEEFETSLEILARVLHAFQLPRLRIEEVIQHFRGDTYEAFRGPASLPNPDLLKEFLPTLQIETLTIHRDAPAAGKTVRELKLRSVTGATLLAVQRNGRMETTPPSDFQLEADDLVVLAGTPRQILDAAALLEQAENGVNEDQQSS